MYPHVAYSRNQILLAVLRTCGNDAAKYVGKAMRLKPSTIATQLSGARRTNRRRRKR